MQRSIKELAQEAIDVQNACNPLGLSKGYAESLQELVNYLRANDLPSDTRTMCNHPINQLWVSKLHDLGNMGMSDIERYGRALRGCELLAGLGN